MRIWMTLFAGTLVLVLGARVGVAQEERRGPPSPANFFERLDADRDGKIALDEIPDGAPEHVKAMLNQADRDGDKALTQDEVAAAMRGMQPGRSRHDDQDKQTPDERRGRSGSRRGEPSPNGDRQLSREIDRADREGHGHRLEMDRSGFGREDRGAPRPGLGRSAGPNGQGFLAGFDKNDREDGKMDREESIGPRQEKSGRMGDDEGRTGDRKGGREAMIAAMKMRLAAHGWRGPAMGHARFGPSPFGRSAGFGPGRDTFKARSSMMGHHGHGFGRQMGPGMQWAGGPRFGRAGMAHHSRGPMMGHRGPGRGPDMGRGMRDAMGPRCDWCPKARGFGGPMMSQRGPGRGPEMGRGMRDAFGPKCDWRPKAPGFGGPMMSQGGPGRGPEMGRGMGDAFGPNRDWRPKAPGFRGPMMSHRGPGRSPEMGRDKTDREGRDFGRGADRGGPRMEQDFRRSDRPDSGHMGKAREPHNSRAKGDPRKIGPKEPDQAKQAAHEEGDTKQPEPKKPDERKSAN